MRSFLIWLFVDLIWANFFWILGIGGGLFLLLMIVGFFLPDPEEGADLGEGGEGGLLDGMSASDARNLAPSVTDFTPSDDDEDGSDWLEELDF